MSSENRDMLTSSFPVSIPFISFFCLTAGDEAASIMQNSRELASFLFLILVQVLQVILEEFNMILAVGLLYIDFTMLSYVFYIPIFSRTFIVKEW